MFNLQIFLHFFILLIKHFRFFHLKKKIARLGLYVARALLYSVLSMV